MVFDKPSWQKGWELEYDSLQPDARRYLTEQEIVWNEELIEEEAATAGPRGSASAATASLGCVVAELFLRRPLLQSETLQIF